MSQKAMTGIVVVATLALCGTGWQVLPALQAPQRTVDMQASAHLERARRLLHGYSPGLTHKSLLIDELAGAGADMEIEDPAALLDGAEDEYQQAHEKRWTAYQPYDYELPAPPSAARAHYGHLAQQVREGLRGRSDLLDRNARILDEALTAVTQALEVTAGDVSATAHAEANRLQGVILYHMALAERLGATLLRQQASHVRRELAALGIHASMRGEDTSGIEEQLAILQARASQDEEKLAELRTSFERIDRTISDLEARAASAEARARKERDAMDKLKRAGLDFSSPDAAEAFKTSLLEYDRRFREASREARGLKYGSYPDAVIDDSGDYLTGDYLERGSAVGLTVAQGLWHYRRERAALQTGLDHGRQAIDALRDGIETLDELREEDRADVVEHKRAMEEAQQRAGEVYTELNRLESEAYAVEEDALGLLDQSLAAERRAAKATQQWVADAGDVAGKLPAETRPQSAYRLRAGSGWMTGHTAAQQADARLAKAWIYQNRFHDHQEDRRILGDLADVLDIARIEADVEVETTKMSDAHDAAVEEIAEAMRILERAHRDAGRHWSFVAQEAAANDLMALLGHSDHTEDAIEAYRNVVKNRESKPYVQTFAARLQVLENR